jgi:hypothetical protein
LPSWVIKELGKRKSAGAMPQKLITNGIAKQRGRHMCPVHFPAEGP